MNDELTTIDKRRKVIIFGAICFVLVIVAISLVASYIYENQDNVDIVNKTNVEGGINNQDYKLISNQLRKLLRSRYELPDSEKINATIRENTYKETPQGKTFIIDFTLDVENVKATYLVSAIHGNDDYLSVSFRCAPASESKYPDVFCIGSEGASSIDSTLEPYLPYRLVENGEEKLRITHLAYEPKLRLFISIKCDDDAGKQKYTEAAKEWISSKGLNADTVPLEYDETACIIYEDNLNDVHGGH